MTAASDPPDHGTSRYPAALRPRTPVDLCKRGEMRVERFLDAATEVFTEKGYQHARLSEIVARAGGSLATLYRVFGDKEGLAHAIVQRGLSNLAERLQVNLSGLPPKQALHLTAEQFSDSVASDQFHVIHRIVIGEGQSFPALRDWYFEHGVGALRSRLCDYFEHEVAAGRLRMASPILASTQFFMMLFGDVLIRISSGNLQRIDPTELRLHARDAVENFLHGTLPR